MGSFIRLLGSLGPGIITAALILGPGSLTVSTKLGAGFGFQLVWVIPVAVLFMVVFVRMSSFIGLAAGPSLLQLIRERFGKPIALIIGGGLFAASASFQAGNSIGTGLSIAELTQSASEPWILAFTSLAIFLVFFRSFYRILEKLMIGLVLIMLISFLLTMIMSLPDLVALAKGLLPSIPSGSEMLVIALVASTFSISGAFYQSYLVKEKGFQISQATECARESRNGIILLGLITMMVMVCASAVLFNQGIEVNTASELGLALEPLFGRFTSSVFMVGFFAASYSSLVGNATIGGALLADTLGMGHRLESWPVRGMIILVMCIGASVAIIFGRIPLQLIVLAQGITILVVPAAGLGILVIANSSLMGNLRNTRWVHYLGVLGLSLLMFLALYNFQMLFL